MKELNIIVIELKENIRHLRDVFHFVIKDCELKINPLQPPPGVLFIVWARAIIDILRRVCGLDFSEMLLMKAVRELELLYGLDEPGEHKFWPSLFELRDHVANQKYPNFSQYKRYQVSAETALTRLIELSGGEGGIFDCSVGMPLLDVFSRNSVFEITTIESAMVKSFLVTVLLDWLYWFKKENASKNTELWQAYKNQRHLVIGDDIQSAVQERQEKSLRESISHFSEKLLLHRQYGTAIMFLIHLPSLTNPTLLAAAHCVICGMLRNEDDVRAISKAMGLSYEQKEEIKRLQVGEFIAVQSFEKFKEPFLFKAPLYEV